MDLSCLLFSMRPRRAAPFLIPTIALYSKQLLLYNSRPLGTHLKSTLLQVFILRNLKPFGINTYEKQGRGYRLWLTKCSKVVSSSILRTHFQVPYPATPLFATLTKTAGVCRVSSHFGTEYPRRKCESRGGGATSAPFSLATRHSPLPCSLRKRLRVDTRHQLQCVLVVHLFQHFVRHLESVNPPERMPVAVILEIFVARLQRPEIPFVFVHFIDVFPHQHTVLILHQEIVRRIGLSPEYRQPRGYYPKRIGFRIEKFSQPVQVIPVKSQVRCDEIRPRMLGKQMIAFRHQRLERRILRRRPRTTRKFLQLLPAFVVIIPRIEKRRRLRHVNQHRDPQLRALLEHRVKLRIVHVHALPIRVLQFHPEVLEDFQPLRAVLDVLFEPLRHALPESRRVQIVITHVREHHKPVRIAPLHRRHRILQPLSGSSAQIHHHAQINRIHLFDELVHLRRRGIPVMAVNINERKLRPLNFMFFSDERGFRLVLVNRRRRLTLLRSLLRHRRARPTDKRYKCSTKGNKNDREQFDGLPGIHSAPWLRESRTHFPTGRGQPPRIPLLESALMPQPGFFRYLLLAGVSVAAGFIALAIAVPIEPQTLAPVIALFS